MTTKVMASTSGMAIATTMPGRQPSARKLTASTMAMASIKRLDELADGLLDDVRLVGDQMRRRCRPAGRRVSLARRSLRCSPNARTSPFLRHRDGEADGRLAVVAEHRLLRVDVGAAAPWRCRSGGRSGR